MSSNPGPKKMNPRILLPNGQSVPPEVAAAMQANQQQQAQLAYMQQMFHGCYLQCFNTILAEDIRCHGGNVDVSQEALDVMVATARTAAVAAMKGIGVTVNDQ